MELWKFMRWYFIVLGTPEIALWKATVDVLLLMLLLIITMVRNSIWVTQGAKTHAFILFSEDLSTWKHTILVLDRLLEVL